MIAVVAVMAYFLVISISVCLFLVIRVADLKQKVTESATSTEEIRRESSAQAVSLNHAAACIFLLMLANEDLRGKLCNWQRVSSETAKIARREARKCGEMEEELKTNEEVFKLVRTEVRNLAAKLLVERGRKRLIRAFEDTMSRIGDAVGGVRQMA